MTPRSKKALWIGVPILVIVAAAAGYKLWWYRVVKNVDITAPMQPSEQIPATDDHVLYLPKTEGYYVGAIDADSKQVLVRSEGVVYLIDGSTGKISQTLEAKNYPELSFTTAIYYEGNYFIAGQQVIKRLDNSGKILNTYTTDNGLVNGFNLLLVPDSYSPHTLWIATFDGLSKLNTATNKFTNYTRDIGVNGTDFNVRSLYLTPTTVWVPFVASSNNRGGIAKLDRATGKWQAFGPESFGKTDRVDFNTIFATDKYTIAITLDSELFKFDSKTSGWTKIGSETASYGPLFIEGDNIYHLDQAGKIVTADLTKKTLDWKPFSQTSKNMLVDNKGGLWIQDSNDNLSRIQNGKSSESLLLPDLVEYGQLIGASPTAVYRSVKGGFSRYEIASGKITTWLANPSKQPDFSDKRILLEAGNYAYLIEGISPGYGGGSESLYRLNLNDSKDFDSYTLPDAVELNVHQLGMANDGTIWLNNPDEKINPVMVFDWQKLSFVKTDKPWQPDSLNLIDDPDNNDYSYYSGYIHKDLTLVIDPPDQNSRTLSMKAQRKGKPDVTGKVELKPLAKSAFGGLDRMSIQRIKIDDFDPNIVWISTTNGLVKFNTVSGETAGYWQGHGALFTGALRITLNKDYLFLDDSHGIYIYPRTSLK